MALSKSIQSPQASAANTAGSTATGSGLAINYGVSGVGQILNGGTGPTVGCDFVLEVSNDGGGSGNTWFEWSRQTAGITAATSYKFPFALGVGGAGGDFGHYRTKFTGNTAQSVTVQADAETTTAL